MIDDKKEFKIIGSSTDRTHMEKSNLSETLRKPTKPILIMIGDSGDPTGIKLQATINKMKKDMETSILILSEAGMDGAKAGLSLRDALSKLKPIKCPINSFNVTDIDFNKVEKFILDSLTITDISTEPEKFEKELFYDGLFYDEARPVSKKAYKELMNIVKKAKKRKSHKQEQTDRWSNKWDKKVKRKL